MSQQKDKFDTGYQEAPPRVSTFQYFRKAFFGRSVVVFGFVVVTLFIFMALFAPLLAPYDPYAQDLDHVMAKPSLKHLLGTDTVGRDTLSRIIYGSRTSLMVGVVALSLAAGIGMSLGLAAGYFGGLIHAVIMRFIDTLMTVPMILLALTIAAVLGGGITNVIIALGIALVPTYARLMCGQAMSIKQNDYVTAVRSIGADNLTIMMRHVAPNCFPPLIVMMTMQIGITILSEAGLSFLGIGINPPGAAWGAMVSEGYRFLTVNPILSFAPGLAIMLVVFAFNMIGDGLRDAIDPRLRGTL
jgi:peptide/nickel transport system permease protein